MMPLFSAAVYEKRFYAKVILKLVLLLAFHDLSTSGSWKVREDTGRFYRNCSQPIFSLYEGSESIRKHRRITSTVIRQIEDSCQRYWEEKDVFRTPESKDLSCNIRQYQAADKVEKNHCKEILENENLTPKFYGLCMIPYPSGDGLHVGHLLGYTVLDVLCRYKRMKGYHVLNPIGWDSFGLPAERYAESVDGDVRLVTQRNIENFKRQLKRMGYSYDWSREIATSDPSYYKWTQWMFQQFYKKDLAYRDEATVNWCPELDSVLANEEVNNGRSDRGGFPVYRKSTQQWLLRITKYAKRLQDDLDCIDWPKSIIDAQKNWIGLEVGYKVTFKYENGSQQGKSLYGFVTDVNSLLNVDSIELSTDINNLMQYVDSSAVRQVTQLVDETMKMSTIERHNSRRRVYTGLCVSNPINNEKLEVYVTDAPLLFSNPINCRIVKRIDRNACSDTVNAQVIASEYTNSSAHSSTVQQIADEDGFAKSIRHGCINETPLNVNGLEPFVNVKLKDWIFSRQRSWGEPIPLKYEGNKYTPIDEALLPLEPGAQHQETMPQWAGSSWHFLRFCDPKNEKEPFGYDKAKRWMPVDIYVGGAEHAVSHLLYARFWNKILYDMGISPVSEPFKQILLHGMIRKASFSLNNRPVDESLVMKHKGKYVLKSDPSVLVSYKLEKMSKSKGNIVSPDYLLDQYGADALRMHLLFLGPVEKDKVWSDQGLKGVFKMLSRIYELFMNVTITYQNQPMNERLKQLVRSITKNIEANTLNTAISDFFKFLPYMDTLPIKGTLSRDVANVFLKLLSPFAPHIAEYIWQELNPDHRMSITQAEWPMVT